MVNVPKPGYVSLNVRQEDAKRLEEFAKKNNLTMVSFAHILAQNLPDMDIHTLTFLLRNIQKVKFHFTLQEEVLKRQLTFLYYQFDAMHSLLSSLFPQPFIDLKLLRIMKIWKDEVLPYIALCDAGVIDSTIDVFKLLGELENVKEALKRILDKNWSDWEKIRPPPLLKELTVPKPLLKIDIVIRPEALETLRNETRPYIEHIADMCYEAENLLQSISTEYPDILKLCEAPLKNFKKLFKI